MKIGLKYKHEEDSVWHCFILINHENPHNYKMPFWSNNLGESQYFTKSTRNVIFFDKIRAAL